MNENIKMAEILERRAAELRARAAQEQAVQQTYKAEVEAYKSEAEAYRNAYEAYFDGLKYTNTMDAAIPLVLPMAIKPNLWYKYDVADVDTGGTRTVLYVGVDEGVCTEEMMAEYLETWETEDSFDN